MAKFKEFLLNFTVAHRLALDGGADFDPESVSENDKRPYYPRVLEHVRRESRWLHIADPFSSASMMVNSF